MERVKLPNRVVPSFPDLYAYERREALGAMEAFTERMGASCKDANLDNDPKTAEYGGEEEKVTLYDDGVPEMIGRKTVERLFEGESGSMFEAFDSNLFLVGATFIHKGLMTQGLSYGESESAGDRESVGPLM